MMVPACDLPAEILSYIFGLLANDFEWVPHCSGGSEGIEKAFDMGWMCVTHVCSLWREVKDYVISMLGQ